MNKDKIKYIVYILIFCIFVTALACFYLGTFFGEKYTFIEAKKGNEAPSLNEEVDEVKNKIEEDLINTFKLLNDRGIIKNNKITLNSVAPFIMEYKYNLSTEEVSGYKLINNEEYQRMLLYFNVSLADLSDDIDAKYLNKGYRILYKIGPKESINITLNSIMKKGEKYIINTSIGEFEVSFINEHIYYNSFTAY